MHNMTPTTTSSLSRLTNAPEFQPPHGVSSSSLMVGPNNVNFLGATSAGLYDVATGSNTKTNASQFMRVSSTGVG